MCVFRGAIIGKNKKDFTAVIKLGFPVKSHIIIFVLIQLGNLSICKNNSYGFAQKTTAYLQVLLQIFIFATLTKAFSTRTKIMKSNIKTNVPKIGANTPYKL